MAVRIFPYEDVDNDGKYTEGVDKDISDALKAADMVVVYRTAHSIVIPLGVKLPNSVYAGGFYFVAGKNITVEGNLQPTGQYSSVRLEAKEGDITVGPRARVIGSDYVALIAPQGAVKVGEGAVLQSVGSSGNMGSLQVDAGHIELAASVRMASSDSVLSLSATKDLVAGERLMLTTKDWLVVDARGALTMDRATLRAGSALNVSAGGALKLTNSRVGAPKGACSIMGKPVDTTGTLAPGCDITT